MESLKKNNILFIAFIFGILSLIVWSVLFFSPLKLISRDFDTYPFFTMYYIEHLPYAIDEIMDHPISENLRSIILFFIPLLYIIVSFISLTAAIVLNLLGWLKNDKKKILFAAILYIISLSVPSIILCYLYLKVWFNTPVAVRR